MTPSTFMRLVEGLGGFIDPSGKFHSAIRGHDLTATDIIRYEYDDEYVGCAPVSELLQHGWVWVRVNNDRLYYNRSKPLTRAQVSELKDFSIEHHLTIADVFAADKAVLS
jgi:hypothetical protein